MNTAIFPSMSKFFISSKDSLKLIYERYFKYMVIIGIPLGVGTTILANNIILLIFGPEFTKSIIALQILIWSIVTTFVGATFVQLLQVINKQIIITKISAICVVINILLNLVLIPKFSYIGASVATVVTEMILVGYIILSTHKMGYGITYKVALKDLYKVIFAALIMGIFLWYFKELNLFVLIILGALLYFVILYFNRGIDKVDIKLLKQLINK
jgi:O-antigen/teichoic acid export membrane protein